MNDSLRRAYEDGIMNLYLKYLRENHKDPTSKEFSDYLQFSDVDRENGVTSWKQIFKNISEVRAMAMVGHEDEISELTFNEEENLSDITKGDRIMEEYVKELQKSFMPEDTKAGIIEGWLEKCGEEYVCALMIFREALNHPYDDMKQWDSREIGKIMNELDGWEMVASHRFGGNYGTQRAWKNEKHSDGFLKIPDDAELPFK